jgi:tetraacyldisaccharide-1-P 4'-kinase
MLREKDYSRADIIIVTHADSIDAHARDQVKHDLLKDFSASNIFMGAHVPAGLFHLNDQEIDIATLGEKKFLLTAGVGSFKGVLSTAQRAGINIHGIKEFVDHYAYTISDLEQLFAIMYDFGCDGIVTTAKDWVKWQPLLSYWSDSGRLPIFVLRVGFEFLSQEEYKNFISRLMVQSQ